MLDHEIAYYDVKTSSDGVTWVLLTHQRASFTHFLKSQNTEEYKIDKTWPLGGPLKLYQFSSFVGKNDYDIRQIYNYSASEAI